ncbi:MAG: glycoside hydrolase family 130 protein [Clostridiales bacterium]|nr:glycoside hydrolase family 130 protein [Clostridiales bacterium]HBM81553.1 glycosidase [Clostridiaceae bacterium]
MICREKENPVIRKENIPAYCDNAKVIGTFNAGAATMGEETVLVVRVAEKAIQREGGITALIFDESTKKIVPRFFPFGQISDTNDQRSFYVGEKQYLTSISHLQVARSKDGVHFKIDNYPFMIPENEYEAFGIEDARISYIGGHYYITYSATSCRGTVVGLAMTDDFSSVKRVGILFQPDNKDTVLFNDKINGKYYALHRPSSSAFAKPGMWLAESPDLRCFGMHRFVAGVRPGKWDCARIGAGAPPFMTEKGWVEFYHGATEQNRYCMGVMLLDKNQPWKVLARSEYPLIEPEYPYELDGFFGNVIFGCGATLKNGFVNLYYGASDESVAMVSMTVQDIYHHLDV